MMAKTVDWTGPRDRPGDAAPTAEGLRERKKRMLRQQLSDTATEMFMQRGFDAVRIIEVAEACGVSEKTVYNYFPTKESLVLDRWDSTMSALRIELAELGISAVEAALRILADELAGMTDWLDRQDDHIAAGRTVRRFGELLDATPALRAHQRDMTDRLTTEAAGVLADRAGTDHDDPRPRIAAIALLGLWDIQARALRRFLDGTRTPAQLRDAVTADVERAARLIADGLSTFAL